MERPPRPWILAETTWAAVRDAPPDVAVLPWGATEAHNLHLPYGTDIVEAAGIAAEAGRLAWERGARIVVLPTMPYGVQTGQLDIPLCVNVNPSTQALLLEDIAASLAGQGSRKLVVLNGHGGNDFRPIIRELQARVDLFVCTLDWYRAVDARTFFDEPGDHAGELETSVMLHLAPEQVRPLEEAGPGAARGWRLDALREGWAWAPRQWTRVTDDTGVGDPSAATAARGAAFVRAATERIGEFLVQLAEADAADLYE